MLRRLQHIAIPIVILAGGAVGVMWLSSMKTAPARVVAPYQPPVVETARIAEHEGSLPIELHGAVVPFREINVSAEVSGRITFKADRAKAGRVVVEKSHLLTIDPEPYQLVIDQLELEARQLEVEREQLELQLKQNAELTTLAERRFTLVKQELTRLDQLKSQNATVQAARDSADKDALVAQTALLVLKQRAAQLPVQLKGLNAKAKLIAKRKSRADIDLARTKIVAPLNAIIKADELEVGSYVEPGDPLFTLQDPSRFEIECSIRSDQLRWLRASVGAAARTNMLEAFELPELPAKVSHTVDGQTRTWRGKLARTDGGGFDRATNTLGCRVVVDDPLYDVDGKPAALIVGMFVDVTIEIAPREKLLALPRGALQPNVQVWELFGGKLRVHRETPIRASSSIILLRQDRTTLRAGTQVVVSTLPMAFDGMTVREAKAEGEAP